MSTQHPSDAGTMLAALDPTTGGEARLRRLRDEDALGQLLGRSGRMAELGTEAGDVKLDWADGVARALADPAALASVEELAESIRARGFRHLVWSGMGGSVQTVHALRGLGLLAGAAPAVHPLDTTDPAALNRLLAAMGGDVRSALMTGVSMGMTSEEPITHLTWFDGLLRAAGATEVGEHLLVMTLPDSSLDVFARERGTRRVDIQLDGESHTPGRMSAPATRVFLLPAALALPPGGLCAVLERCQAEYRLHASLSAGERDAIAAGDPFVRLAAWLSAQVAEGRDMLLLDLPERWRALGPWVEQVVEESLGKGGRGLLVFHGQDLAAAAAWPDRHAVLRVDEGTGRAEAGGRPMAVLRLSGGSDLARRLAVVARFCAGWELAVALFGYLEGITFAGQPAVEAYKRYARELRLSDGPLPYPADTLAPGDVAEALTGTAAAMLAEDRLAYLDLTINADPDRPTWDGVRARALAYGNHVLRRPVKLRSGPRDYHSTEQSETDGPPGVLSLRVLVRRTEDVAAGEYDTRFLHAQALGTVRAMRDAGRPPLLAILETPADAAALEAAFPSLADS
jgi:glucose-6-phosphate isomerase